MMNAAMAHRFDKRARRLLATLAVLVAGAIAAFALASAPALAQSSEDVQVQARDFFGTIVSVDEGVIVVASDGVDVEVTVGEETDVRIPSRPEAGLGDLRVGDVVAVSLDPSGEADRIQLIPGKTRSRHVPGEVVALSESQISILTLGASAATVTFERGASTEVKFHQGTTELAVGDFVVIVALRDPSGELGTQALEINVTRRQIREVPDPKVEDAGANTVEIQGVFEGIDDDGNWIVDGRTILIDEDTEIAAALKVGQTVEIEAVLLPDGSVLAREVDVEDEGAEVRTRTVLNGVFEGLDEDGSWIVSGTAVRVDETTDTDGLPAEGQRVKVKAFLQEDGSLLAREIENKGGAGDPGDDDEEREVKLEGTFQGVDDDGNWIVNGIKIAVSALTKLEGTPAVGQEVEVKAIRQEDGTLLATKVEGEGADGKRPRSETKIRGIIEEITDGFVVIDGLTVALAALTELEGDLSVGSFAKVKAFLQADGSLIAREVEGKGPDAAEDEDERNEVEIEGVIDAVNPDGSIVVNGVTVTISALTEIKGSLVAGATVKVEGFMAEDGSVLASEVKGEGRKATRSKNEVRIGGVVEALTLDEDGNVVSIVVNGMEVSIGPLTELKGTIDVGASVRVEGIFVDGELHAGEVKASGRGRGQGPGRGEDPGRGQGRGGDGEGEDEDGDSIKIEGTVDALILDADGSITGVVVNGVEVSIDPLTDIEGVLEVGSEVEIKGTVRDGVLVATEVELEEADDEDKARGAEVEIEGVIEAIELDDDGNVVSITVDGQLVAIEPLTRLKGIIEVGAVVEIDAVLTGDGLVARKVSGDKGEVGAEAEEEDEDGGEKDEKIELEGVIETVELDDDGSVVSITVDGQKVAIGPETDVKGTIEVGSVVEIDAVLTDDGLVARKVRGDKDDGGDDFDAQDADVEDGDRDVKIKIEGVIEAVERDGDGNVVSITVDGQEVAIGPETDVRGTIEVGAVVEIDAVSTDDGLVAEKVRVDESDAGSASEDEDDASPDGDGDEGDDDGDDSSGSGSDG
ncbi:MAG: hypothetical protein IIC95_03780 [Chloroflexi bacterium]|nr:hypothetical protein [Chloroflexota bacterium]